MGRAGERGLKAKEKQLAKQIGVDEPFFFSFCPSSPADSTQENSPKIANRELASNESA